MSRPLRIEFPGALYHVTSRGDGSEAIYLDDRDRVMFLNVLAHVCERFHWACHGYCLMTNHYHLLVETPDAKLGAGMRQLNGIYTQRFNRRHHRVGHIYQGRYKAILVQKESHLLELARYVVLNPVRAAMVRSARDWRWSSYRATAGLIEPPSWLHVDWLLARFDSHRQSAIRAYRRFVSEGRRQASPWEALRQQLYLGEEGFVESTQARIENTLVSVEVPAVQHRPTPHPLGSYEKDAPDREQAIIAAYRSGAYSMKAIGNHFGLHLSRISQIVRAADSPCWEG